MEYCGMRLDQKRPDVRNSWSLFRYGCAIIHAQTVKRPDRLVRMLLPRSPTANPVLG